MLKLIRENPDLVRQNIKNKNESACIDNIIELDGKRRAIIQEVEKLKNIRNTVTQEISVLKKNKENADEKIAAMKEVADKIKGMDEELRGLEIELEDLVLSIPNMLHSSVHVGRDEKDNKEIRKWGNFNMVKSKDHMEIAKEFGLIDFERGAKVTGSGFHFYTGKGAKLERAVINYMLDFHTTKNGYKEIMPPFVANAETMTGTGQLPKMAEDMYHCTKDDLYLIPTAEVPLTNFYSKNVLSIDELPLKICGYSPCFRREAGSYGKDNRGLLRVHQFNKVELVKFTKPEDSYNELELLVVNVEDVLKSLNLPYHVILLCSGDTSFSSAKTYDLEVWSPGEQKYLEVSSCSNFEAFQAKRANIKYKPDPNSKPEFVHTLNGSGLATPRLIVSLLENNLMPDGTINIPEPLREYTKFDKIEKI